jgi:hypothetical protein
MGPIRPWYSLLAILLLVGCPESGSLVTPGGETDDDDAVVDDDDSAPDDDDSATDDDDFIPDDDDIAPDDDDIWPDDDDIAPDDDDFIPDDDDFIPDDDDFIPDDDDIAPDDDDAVPPVCPSGGSLECGIGLASNNGTGTNDTEWYACYGGGLSGPELTFSIDPTATAEYTFSLTGLSDDLDLYLLGGADCDAAACLAGSWNGDSDDEQVQIELEAGESYVLAVDGWSGAVSDFVLEVSCDGGGDDDDAAPDDDDAAPDDDDVVFPDDDDATGVDNDFDGYTDIDDCDDNDPLINPGAPEFCDAVDNNCDDSIDEGGVCSGCIQGEYDGHTYQTCPGVGGMNWTGAESTCDAYGYYIATVNSQAEQDFLAAQGAALAGGSLWIGYNDRGWGNEGSFYWSAGNGSGYEAWNSGEPNSSGNEDCVEMRDNQGWLWNDMNCSTLNSWICELD